MDISEQLKTGIIIGATKSRIILVKEIKGIILFETLGLTSDKTNLSYEFDGKVYYFHFKDSSDFKHWDRKYHVSPELSFLMSRSEIDEHRKRLYVLLESIVKMQSANPMIESFILKNRLKKEVND